MKNILLVFVLCSFSFAGDFFDGLTSTFNFSRRPDAIKDIGESLPAGIPVQSLEWECGIITSVRLMKYYGIGDSRNNGVSAEKMRSMIIDQRRRQIMGLPTFSSSANFDDLESQNSSVEVLSFSLFGEKFKLCETANSLEFQVGSRRLSIPRLGMPPVNVELGIKSFLRYPGGSGLKVRYEGHQDLSDLRSVLSETNRNKHTPVMVLIQPSATAASVEADKITWTKKISEYKLSPDPIHWILVIGYDEDKQEIYYVDPNDNNVSKGNRRVRTVSEENFEAMWIDWWKKTPTGRMMAAVPDLKHGVMIWLEED